MALTFQQPPLHEVALGVTFLPRPDLLIPHLGSFWNVLRTEYPRCQHAAPIFDGPDTGLMGDLPLPRVWFVSDTGARLVQLQQDRLILNWRNFGPDAPYVRFPAIRQEFERVLSAYRIHVANLVGEPLRDASYTLAYVNIIREGQGWRSFEDVSGVFPDTGWRDVGRFLPRPVDLAWKASFSLPEGLGRLVADLKGAKIDGEKKPVLRFELSAHSGSLGGRSVDLEHWVDVAHQWIVHSFKDLTSETMHTTFWELQAEGDS